MSQQITETQVAGERVISENNRLVGAAVRYRGKTYVDSGHPMAWNLAREDKDFGEEIEGIYQSGLDGLLDLKRWEGFMTTEGFVKTREEATEVARRAGQLKSDVPQGHALRSEDVKDWAPPSAVVQSALHNCTFRRTS